MGILGVNFTKLGLEKTGQIKGKVNIRNNVIITSVDKGDFTVGTAKQPLLKVGFEFTVMYEPKIAKVEILGELLFLESEAQVDELQKSWQKDKSLPKDIKAALLTSIIQRANIEALILSREVGLPPPIQLPRVNIK